MRFFILFIALFFAQVERLCAQQLLTDMIDTTTELGKGMLSIYQKFGTVRFSGYLQPQFQIIEDKGAKSYGGGDFATYSDNRFFLRRGRLRMDYTFKNDEGQLAAYFVFQFDGTDRAFVARDYWGRFYENKWQLFQLTTGMFARPFGYELNLGSGDRESPERGRMSQFLMKTERDLGAMISLEPRKSNAKLNWLKVDLGVFNGQGLAGVGDYDSYKDIIGRISFKPRTINALGKAKISGGVSGLFGAVGSQSPKHYEFNNGKMVFDSSTANINKATPRRYYGADLQIKFPNKKGFTEFRLEYIRGLQTATANSSETPGVYPVSNTNTPQPLYTRPFDGAYFYFLQHLASWKHQILVKYDWYDPNTSVQGKNISSANGFSAADIKFQTLGIGYVYYINTHLKSVMYVDFVQNELTDLTGFDKDLKDNLFTWRFQYSF